MIPKSTPAMAEATWLRLRLADIREEIEAERAWHLVTIRDQLLERGAALDESGAAQILLHTGYGASSARGLEALYRNWIAAVAHDHGEAPRQPADREPCHAPG